MTSLAPTLEAFFTDRLMRERHASSNTVAAYRDTFRLLLRFTQERIGKEPSQLELSDLDTPLLSVFLDHLEHERGNRVRTRNARLAALRQAADREATLFEQRIMPLLRQRNPQSRQQALDSLTELAEPGSQWRSALVESLLRHHFEGH